MIYNCNMQTIAWCIWRGNVSRYLSLEFTYLRSLPFQITWPHDGIQSCSAEMQWLLIKVKSPSFHMKNLVKILNCTLPLVGIIQIVVKMHSGLISFQGSSQKKDLIRTSLIKQYFHGFVLVSGWEGSAQSEVISFRWILELRTVEILPWDGVNTVVSSYANQHPWMEVIFLGHCSDK